MPTTPEFTLTPRQKKFEYALWGLILARVVLLMIRAPLGADESFLASTIYREGLKGIPFPDMSFHPFASYFCYGSIKLFGMGKIQASLLGPLSTLFFLFAFGKVSDYLATPPLRFLILGCFLVNAFLIRHATSLKPHLLTLALSFVLIYFVLLARTTDYRRWHLFLFALLILFTPVIQPVLSIFIFSLLLGTYVCFQNRKIVLVGLTCLVITLPVYFLLAMQIVPKNLGSDARPWFALLLVPRELFGWTSSVWVTYSLPIFLGGLGIWMLKQKPRWDFLTVLLFSSLFTLVALVAVLKVNIFFGRYVLWLSPLILLWVGRQFTQVNHSAVRLAGLASMAVCFLAVPMLNGLAFSRGDTPQGFAEEFMIGINRRTSQPQKCFTYAGDTAVAASVLSMYFPHRETSSVDCKTRYLFYLPDRQTSRTNPYEKDPRYRLLDKDAYGNALFEIVGK